MSTRWSRANMAAMPPHISAQIAQQSTQGRRSPGEPHPDEGRGGIVAPGAANAVRRNKYGAVATRVDGIRFASRLEADCYRWLVLRRCAGEVAVIVRQAVFDLPGLPTAVRYLVDFVCPLTAGGIEYWDAKGRETPMSRDKRKQVLALHGIEVRLWPAR